MLKVLRSQDGLFSTKLLLTGLTVVFGFSLLVHSIGSTADAQGKKKPSRPAGKKAPAKKPEEPLPPRFEVKSEGVDSSQAKRASYSAKKIDSLVEGNYKKYKITPNPKSTDEQFVRRVYLDITGTIPTLREARAFLVTNHPEKRARLIDKLLASDGYASHSFNYWADILRITDRLNNNVYGNAYRQWLKQSLAENKPWDDMVSEMMTAEGNIWENPATGYMQRDSGMPLDNMNNTIRIFLGTRIGCAQCHDHPFDHWTQKEFYQIAAFMYPTLTRRGGRDKMYNGKNPSTRLRKEYKDMDGELRFMGSFNRLIRENMQAVYEAPSRKLRLPKDYAYSDAKPNDLIEAKTLFTPNLAVNKGDSPRKVFAEWLTSKQNPRFAKSIANRMWKRALGVGLIEPEDDIQDDSEVENPELMAYLESEMKRLNFDMKEFLRIVYNTRTYQRQANFEEESPGEPYHYPGPLLRRMTAEQIWDSFLTLAVVNPNEYKEVPASLRDDLAKVNLNGISAQGLLDREMAIRKETGGGTRSKRQKKYRYKGLILARASELPLPTPPDHFLRQFGQSARELISGSSTDGSVPQVLTMFNGPITHMLLEDGSTMYNNVVKEKKMDDQIEVIFLTILSRKPSKEEHAFAEAEIKSNGKSGYGNVIWSLVNTREFLFVQ